MGKMCDGFYITDKRNTDMFILVKADVPKSKCKSDLKSLQSSRLYSSQGKGKGQGDGKTYHLVGKDP